MVSRKNKTLIQWCLLILLLAGCSDSNYSEDANKRAWHNVYETFDSDGLTQEDIDKAQELYPN